MQRGQAVRDGSQERVGVEAILFCEKRGDKCLLELVAVHRNDVTPRVIIKARALNEDMGAPTERGIVNASSFFRQEVLALGCLELLLSVADANQRLTKCCAD